jgi:pimeloyl-ACP methyl ester carboxylesterase
VLLIHGNSSCRGVFRHQLEGRLAQNHRLIAFDLRGHGQSSNAPDPTQSYTRPGLADAAVELLEKLGVTEAIVFGWYFDPVLERFLRDVETGRASTGTL